MIENPLVAVFVLTSAGSAACFGAGYSAGRLVGNGRRARNAGELEQLRTVLSARVAALETELAAATDRRVLAEGDLARESAAVTAATERVQLLEAELVRASVEVDGLRERARVLEASTNELRQRAESAERAAAGPRRTSLRPAAEAARDPSERARPDAGGGPALEQARQGLARAQQERDRARQELQQARKDTQRASADRLKAQQELARVREELKKAEQELTHARAARAEQEAESKRHLERIALKDAELARRSGRIEALEAELDAERARSAALEQKQGSRSEEPTVAAASGLITELARLQARCAELEASVAVAGDPSAELTELRQRLAEAEDERLLLETRQAGAAAYVRRAQEAAKLHSERAAALEADLREARQSLPSPALPGRVAELEREVTLLRSAASTTAREETHELRLRVSQLQPRAEVADRLEAENASLRDRVEELSREVADSAELRQRTARLEARLFALGESAPEARGSVPPPPASSPASTQSTAAGLAQLVALPSVRSAALADGHGLLVAAAGDEAVQEELAAVTGLAGHLATQAVQILPLAEIGDVSFRDRNAIVVACRFFDCYGDHMALITLGSEVPPAGHVDRVVAAVLDTMVLPGEASTPAAG